MSQSTTKSVVDTLGFIPVLPGPCSLFRYKAFLAVSTEYFQLTTQPLRGDSSDVVLGNVQLAEDRFPPVLIQFGKREEDDDDAIHNNNNDENQKKKRLPVTGFEHDAVFYFEAEKPLGQLVRQRRRWINGAYMAAYWAVRGGWIGRSNHGMIRKIGAAAILIFEVVQGAMIRLIVPATCSCGLFFMVRIIPAIYEEDEFEVQRVMDGEVGNPLSQLYGCIAAAVYMGGFAIFMIAHTPRAVPSDGKPGDILTYHIDTRTAYRPRLFFMGYMLNFGLTIMFVSGFTIGMGRIYGLSLFLALTLWLCKKFYFGSFMSGMVSTNWLVGTVLHSTFAC